MSHLSSQPPEITAENLSQSPRSAGSAGHAKSVLPMCSAAGL
jgi:hypothetical protein